MKKIFIICILILIFLFPQKVKAQTFDNSILQEQLQSFDFSTIESLVNDSQTNEVKLNFRQLLEDAINGKIDLSLNNIINSTFKLLFNEIYANGILIKNLIIIALLSALFKNLTESFKRKEIGELGFYVSYIILIIVLFNSFKIGFSIMTILVSDLAQLMEATLPLITSMLLMSGQVSSVYAYNPIIIFTITVITRFIRDFIAPLIVLVAVMEIVNFLSVKEILSKLTEQIRKSISFILKCTGILFISVLSMQKISAPIINNFVTKTAKISVGAIPIVGEVLTGAVDTVMFWGQATRSGFIVASVVVIIMICSIPIIKLISLIVIYKVTASIIQPICDIRIVNCIDSIGSLTVLLLGGAFTVSVMFIFYIMIALIL